MTVQIGTGYHIAELLRAALSVDINGSKEKDVDTKWIPSLSAELRFEL